MEKIDVPLTSWELREIARVLDETERKFGDSAGDAGLTKFGKRFYQINLEVLRPDSDEIVGRITYYDGWLGFYPAGSVE
jgi:hypothetical protein